MSESEVHRLVRDVEDLLLRIRALEGFDTPLYRQLLAEFRTVQHRVAEFAEQGTPVAQREIKSIDKDITDIKRRLDLKADQRDLDRIDEEAESNRRMVRTALIAAALSLGGTLVAFFIERAVNRGP